MLRSYVRRVGGTNFNGWEGYRLALPTSLVLAPGRLAKSTSLRCRLAPEIFLPPRNCAIELYTPRSRTQCTKKSPRYPSQKMRFRAYEIRSPALRTNYEIFNGRTHQNTLFKSRFGAFVGNHVGRLSFFTCCGQIGSVLGDFGCSRKPLPRPSKVIATVSSKL